jgi:hypothetical protein
MNHIEEPRIYWCRERRNWITDTPVSWYDRPTRQTISVPAGFVTDLASVPCWLHPIVAPAGNWNRASVVHDWLYAHKGVITGSGKKLTRKQCDRIFLDIAIVDGTNPFVAFVGYYGIRANPFNWPLFKKW